MHELSHERQLNQKRVTEATRVSGKSRRIVNEMKTIPSGTLAMFATHRKKILVLFPKSKLGNFDECVIRNIVNYVYITDKQKLTRIKIHAKLLQSEIINCKKGDNELGFRGTKTEINRQILVEFHNIIALRMS
jgi:hypothetical protein